MGNFLGCFGGSDDSRKRRKQRDNVVSREQRHVVQGTPQRTISTEAPPANLVSQDITEEKLSLSARKRVTFDENVTTYEHVSVYESTETLPEKTITSEKEKEKPVDKPSQSSSSTEDGSVISSVGSYPSNHRYQNCKDSDDEGEEFGDCDLDDEDFIEDDDADEYFDNDEEGEGKMLAHEIWSETVLTASMESSSGKSLARVNSEEVDSPLIPKGYVRDRSAYVHPVLNPVENLSQWKALKSKAAQPVKPLKENLPSEQEAPRISFSSEPTFKQNQKFDQSKVHNQEIAVNASLSNWLVSSETSPAVKTSFSGFETVLSANTASGGSNSVRSFEDRPILGALTVEELKQLSASASPRRSPSRSPDEIPIIGTVGTYWNDSGSVKSPSSFKGIPNTTSKYREDKRVNWHSTPFETRLERALNRGAAEA